MDALGAGDVDIWIVQLTPMYDSSIAALEDLLAPAERERANAFHFVHDRRDYIVSHALLRAAVARYVHDEPATLAFTSSALGRPTLAGGPHSLDFSLTHAEGLAAVAVSRGAAVGVDAEKLHQCGDHVELADRWFAAEEARALRALPTAVRHRAFLEVWTLKEAYAKACGAGLSLPLDTVAFGIPPNPRPVATFAPAVAAESSDWRFALLRPTERHVLAVARRGSSPLRPRLRAEPHPVLRAARPTDR